MSLTAALCTLIRDKPVTAADRRRAAWFVLDALANAWAGRNSGPGDMLCRWYGQEPRDAARLAFWLGGLTHILETDDLHRGGVVHPGCVVVPAAIAVARRENRRGRALLDAVLFGYEACCRVGMAVGPAHYRLWHNTATCGPYGSAMAAAALMGLDHGATVHALGNAGAQSGGLWEFLATGAMTKHLHAGRAADAGVIAADLARLGFTGPPAILEGEKGFFAAACPDADPAAVVRDPDAPWQLHLTSVKPWPSCRHTHPAVDAALDCAGQIDGREVHSVTVTTYQAALDVCDRPVARSNYEAKFSLQHTVAAALADGSLGFASFDHAARQRHAALAARVEVAASADFSRAYPAAWGARVEAQLSGGGAVQAERRHAKGDPEAPLSDDDMTAKARQLLAFAGTPMADGWIAAVMALADDGPLPALPTVDAPARRLAAGK